MRKRKEVQRELTQKMELMRTLSSEEGRRTECETAMNEIQDLTEELNQINIAEAAERALAESMISEDLKEKARNFSFAKFFRELASKDGLTGVELEMANVASEECKRSGVTLKGVGIPLCVLSNNRAFDGMTAGTNTDGGYTIETTLKYQEALRKKLVLASAGAQYISGLIGNISIVDGKEITAYWEGENTPSKSEKKQFSQRSLGPIRLSVTVPISTQLITQSTWDVENMIVNDILNAHAQAIEIAAINGSGIGQPKGILNTDGIGNISMGSNGAAPTFKAMVDLETCISMQNADLGSLSYITNSKVRGALKTILKATGVPGYIWENNEVNGYRALASNIVPSDIKKGTGTGLSASIFGNFSDMLICQWGGLDIISDPYSLKKEAALEITINAYHNVFVRRSESFAAIKDLVA